MLTIDSLGPRRWVDSPVGTRILSPPAASFSSANTLARASRTPTKEPTDRSRSGLLPVALATRLYHRREEVFRSSSLSTSWRVGYRT